MPTTAARCLRRSNYYGCGLKIYIQHGVISPSVGAGAQYNWPLYLVLLGVNPSVGDEAQNNWSIYVLKAQRPSRSETCSRHKGRASSEVCSGHKGRASLKSAQGTKAESVCSRCRAAIAFSTWFASIVVTPAPLLLPAVRFEPRPLRRRRLVSRCSALQHAVLDEARTAILVIDAVARADCAHKLAVGHRCVSVGRSSRSSYRFS